MSNISIFEAIYIMLSSSKYSKTWSKITSKQLNNNRERERDQKTIVLATKLIKPWVQTWQKYRLLKVRPITISEMQLDLFRPK